MSTTRRSVLCWTLLVSFLLLVVVDLPTTVKAWAPPVLRPSTLRYSKRGQHQNSQLLHATRSSKDDNEDEGDEGEDLLFERRNGRKGPEKSRMQEYVLDFLTNDRNDNPTNGHDGDDDGNSFTHLIAFPVEFCHELSLELESVQRGILYHCPLLVHSCIAGAMTRLPLLYVKIPETSAVAQQDATDELTQMVEAAVGKHVVHRINNAESEEQEFLNAEGIQPLNIQFQNLEIDGGNISANEVLLAATEPDSTGTRTIKKLVQELEISISQRGWRTRRPESSSSNKDNVTFRPRVPFMRLPDNWNSYLEHQLELSDNDIDEIFLLTADEGGNGISPILWGRWADDMFGGPQRLREIAVYQRASGKVGLTERSFPLPAATVPLPDGNAAQRKSEAAFEEYQKRRMVEAEAALKKDQEDSSGGSRTSDESPTVSEDDLLLSMTKEKLERIYSAREAAGPDNYSTEEVDLGYGKSKDLDSELTESQQRRIEKAVMSRARVQSELDLAQKRDKPPIEENTVFAKYKDGSLVPEKDKVIPGAKDLPPFPSKEHCTGFWRMLDSPTGFAVEEGDASRSDNLVLRVDGTIAGGPILDQVTRQKASGGAWMLNLDNKDDPILRIRLLIPPKKERVLVMEGRLESKSMTLDVLMAPNTFGIPALEERAAKSAAADESNETGEEMTFCKGSVWIEDSKTKGSRDVVGTFSIMKLKTPTDPSPT